MVRLPVGPGIVLSRIDLADREAERSYRRQILGIASECVALGDQCRSQIGARQRCPENRPVVGNLLGRAREQSEIIRLARMDEAVGIGEKRTTRCKFIDEGGVGIPDDLLVAMILLDYDEDRKSV